MSNEFRNLSKGVNDPVRHDSNYIDHVGHARPGIKVFPDKLYVICPISNPRRFRTRYELYKNYEKHIEESGAILYTIEMAFGGREFEITQANHPRHIQVRGQHEIWYKENLINIAISKLPPDWKYVAWVDGDCKFVRDDWAQETIHQLQHHQIVQMWSQLQDVSPDFELLPTNYPNSFCHNWCNGRSPIKLPGKQSTQYPYPINDNKSWYGPPGLAWAARREAIDSLGGLIDWGIVGSGDSYMASSLIGGVQYQLRKDFHPDYVNQFMIWQDRAEKHIRRNIGCVNGLVIHYYHGNKTNRKYVDRNNIVATHKFNPLTDLKKDWQGLYQLVDHGDVRSMNLRDELRNYFRHRNEDSTDI